MTRQTSVLLLTAALLAFFLTVGAGDVPSTGEDLVQRLGCLGCHSLQGQGGDKGPAWDGLGARLTPEAIRRQILTPRGRMPSFAQIKPQELKALVTYLSGLK